MEVGLLTRLYPRLFHLTAGDSWPSIHRRGLASAAGLAHAAGLELDPAVPRRDSLRVDLGNGESAVIRDQRPIHLPSLEVALDGRMSTDEWLAELNRRVFFFVQRRDVERLVGSPAYRRDIHLLLEVDTASLVAAHRDAIELAGINTGFAQRHNHVVRGRDTFRPLADYAHPVRQQPLTSRRELVELVVPHAVPDILDHLVSVDRIRQGEFIDRVWSKPVR